MKLTTNLNLKKPDYEDDADIAIINENMDKIDAQISSLKAYAEASGTNTYTATIAGITTLIEGMTVKIKFANANTGASTLNINNLGVKTIVKSNGNALSSGNIKAGQICNLAYTGSNFQLLGEGGEYGTATDSEVLSGKTIGTEEGIVIGTMPNRGAVNQNLTTEGQEYTIPAGYHNGLGKIKAVITGLIASVIKAGATVGGILGTFTSDATAADADVLSGKTYYRNGTKGTGSMVDRGTVSQTLSTQGGSYTIPAGRHNGSGKVTAAFSNLVEGNVKKGVNVGGVVGTLGGLTFLGSADDLESGIIYMSNSYMDNYRSFSVYNETVVINAILFSFSDGGVCTITSDDFFWIHYNGMSAGKKITKSHTNTNTTGNHIIYNPDKASITIVNPAKLSRNLRIFLE